MEKYNKEKLKADMEKIIIELKEISDEQDRLLSKYTWNILDEGIVFKIGSIGTIYNANSKKYSVALLKLNNIEAICRKAMYLDVLRQIANLKFEIGLY